MYLVRRKRSSLTRSLSGNAFRGARCFVLVQNPVIRFTSPASLLMRQLGPEPRVGWGLLLGKEQLATAMIDISDGLSSDLNHLCNESKVGALINAAAIPIDP